MDRNAPASSSLDPCHYHLFAGGCPTLSHPPLQPRDFPRKSCHFEAPAKLRRNSSPALSIVSELCPLSHATPACTVTHSHASPVTDPKVPSHSLGTLPSPFISIAPSAPTCPLALRRMRPSSPPYLLPFSPRLLMLQAWQRLRPLPES
jgi:hypothetical protein